MISYIKSRPFQLSALFLTVLAVAFGLVPESLSLLPLAILNTADGGGSSDASAPGASSSAPAAAPASGDSSTTDAGGPPSSATPADDKKKPDNRSAATRAYDRAEEKRAGKKTDPSKTPAGQAAGGGDNPAAGASTPPGAGDNKTADPNGTAADGKGGKPSDSTVTIPQDWPAEDRAAAEKLPNEGRALLLDIHKRMKTGLDAKFNEVAEERRANAVAIEVAERFQADPKATIAELAKAAGIEVFFDKPQPSNDDVPSQEILNDPVKYGQWVAEKAARDARKVIEAERDERDKKDRIAQTEKTLKEEFSKAATDHKDFEQRRPEVLKILSRAPHLTVEEAYQLSTYSKVQTVLSENEKLRTELATAQGELERLKKNALRPPAGGAAPGEQKEDEKNLSPGARAYERAARKISARSAARA